MEKKSNFALSVLIAVVLTACVMTETKTVKQRYYVVKSSYAQALTGVAGYVRYCTGQVGEIKASCDKNITKIKEMDSALRVSIHTADLLLETKDIPLLESNVNLVASQVAVLGMFVKGLGGN